MPASVYSAAEVDTKFAALPNYNAAIAALQAQLDTLTTKIDTAVDNIADRLEALEAGTPPPDPDPDPEPTPTSIDLVVTNVTYTPANPKVGDAASFQVTVKNQGGTDVDPGTNFGTSIGEDGTVLTWANHNAGLAKGQSVTLDTSTGLWPGGPWTPTTAGPHTLEAWVDDTGLVPEGNENNNKFPVTVTVAPGPPPPVVTGRYYTANSSWNTKIPANATFVDNPSIRSGGGWFSFENFAVPFVISSPTDPIVTVKYPNNSWGWAGDTVQLRIPANGYGASGSDGSLTVLDPTTNIAHDFWQMVRAPGATTASASAYARSNVVTDDGWGWPAPAGNFGGHLGAGIHVSGSALLAGNIINNELTAGINHTAAISMRHDMSTGYPNVTGRALSSDGGGGSLNMGERLAIPPNVAMPNWLKPQEQSFWRCMQTYGGFLVDTHGGNASIQWGGDSLSLPADDAYAVLNPGVWNAPGLTAIVQQLRIVR